jgi:uncharacterized membrane protein YraQ (UPF0718 family)
MITIGHEIIRILNESSVYLLLGFSLAGLLHVLMQRFPGATAALTGKGKRPVFLASLIGLPMPLCSCGVLPAALALRKNGASKGATASFLVSVPETDIVSILLTLALMGPLMAIFRPAAALVTAIAAGLLVNWIDNRKRATGTAAASTATTTPSTKSTVGCCHEPSPAPAEPVASCCGEKSTESSQMDEPSCHCEDGSASEKPRQKSWITRAAHFGFVEIFDDVILQLIFGFILAGVIVTLLPALELQNLVGDSPLLYLVMLVVGVPVYVCATASTPLAAGLIAGGISPGAAMVFLLAGPATNIAGLLVLQKQFGGRVLTGYLVAIAVCSVFAGALLDRLIGPGFTLPVTETTHVHHNTAAYQIACTVVLAALATQSLVKTRLLPLFSRQV